MNPMVSQQSMDTDTGLGKDEEEEEDDTMQNTVVLFSNTDKFVLQQVPNVVLRHPLSPGFGIADVVPPPPRTCAWFVAVSDAESRDSFWHVPSVPSATIPTALTARCVAMVPAFLVSVALRWYFSGWSAGSWPAPKSWTEGTWSPFHAPIIRSA